MNDSATLADRPPARSPAKAAAPPEPAAPPVPADAAPPPRRAQGAHDLYIYLLITALVVGSWGFTRLGLYDSKSNTAYWLGVAGGVGMLLLLSYPMRKHLGFMRRAGPAGHWFFGHMLLGVAGPVLILLHSGFQIGSLNAGVAFYSMVIVALSGVIGRFLYLRVHRSLNGEQETLASLRGQLTLDDTAATRLRFAPAVIERCRRFERYALEQPTRGGFEVIRTMLVMPWVRWSASFACRAELRRRLVAVAHTEGWSRRQMKGHLRQARQLADAYLMGAQRVALFAAWHRLFSWWHVAHVPFVYILAISAVVHVVAVHAY